MKVQGDNVIFSSGRTASANNGIIGISEQDLDEVYEGYDGNLDPTFNRSLLSTEDKLELADYMVNLWMKYRRRARREEGEDGVN